MRQKGFAIILVLATLVLLAMLSLTYIKLALIDRNIARNYMDNKRAKLIAQSGVDYAVARIQENLFDTSWQEAKTITINGIPTKYTESSGSTYGEDRDIFKVEVKDSNSMINVNDGLDNDRVKGNLKRMLNTLGEIVSIDEVKTGGKLGDRIIAKRPAQGYSSKQDILRAVNSDTTEFGKFKDLVTTHAWQDPNVANPVPLSGAVLEKYKEFNDGYANYDSTIGVYRYGRGKDRSEALITGDLQFAPEYVTNLVGKCSVVKPEYSKYAIYALDELNPQWIEIVSRSPVNINSADEEILKVLIKDLKGIFVSERRSINPSYFWCYSPLYDHRGSMDHNYTHDNESDGSYEGDQLGFLHSTELMDYDIVNDQGLTKDIVTHIIGCRDKRVVTTGVVTIDYTDAGSLWFRGPFKTWGQFNAFVDKLVEARLVQDTRNLSEYRLDKSLTHEAFNASRDDLILATSKSPVKKIAHQAKADVLKANFNPNLHLNESNPDANISTLIDKTDLIVNSTEFCFTPMGYFEIESLGSILRQSGADNIIIAKQKVVATAQLYDCYRETNQKQFLNHVNNQTDYNNFMGQDSMPVRTNNSRTIQIGPEPDHAVQLTSCACSWKSPDPLCPNCPCPGSERKNDPCNCPPYETDRARTARDNEWGGYISLPTLKGPNNDPAATLYSNFSDNFNADYHADGSNSNITIYNSADPTELKSGGVAEPAGKGPYMYGFRNRLSRSFRKGDTIDPKYYAVSDLRIDGAYVERHASVVYDIPSSGSPLASNVMKSPGFWSYWVKPWFHPESTGKARTFVSFSKYVGPLDDNVFLFANWYFASHGESNLNEPNTVSDPAYQTSFYYKLSTIIFAYTCYSSTQLAGIFGGGRGISTSTLNHIHHEEIYRYGSGPFCSFKPTFLKSGHWSHVVCYWDLGNTDAAQQIKILVNGTEIYGKQVNGTDLKNLSLPSHAGTVTMSQVLNYCKRVRLGEPIISTSDDKFRNWTADATIDEFYIFSGTDSIKATDIYFSSRYYKPSSSTSYFISQELQLKSSDKTPRNSTITNPDGSLIPAGDLTDKKTKILGLSWTWYAEDTDTINISDPDKFGKPILKNCKNYKDTQSTDNMIKAATFKYPVVKIRLLKNYDSSSKTSEAEYGPFDQDGYSFLQVEMDSTANYKYEVIIDIPNIAPDTVLLYSPVFDDITIYYTSGVEFLSYTYLD